MAIHAVMAGRMASGKTTMAKRLEQLGFRRIVTYTTRPIRQEEQSGIDYHFISETEFLNKRENGFFAETIDFDSKLGHVYFGSAVQDYQSAENTVIVLNPDGVRSVINAGIDARIVYLNVPASLCRERALARGDVAEEVDRRIRAEDQIFHALEARHDYTFKLDLSGNEPEDAVLDSVLTLLGYPSKDAE